MMTAKQTTEEIDPYKMFVVGGIYTALILKRLYICTAIDRDNGWVYLSQIKSADEQPQTFNFLPPHIIQKTVTGLEYAGVDDNCVTPANLFTIKK